MAARGRSDKDAALLAALAVGQSQQQAAAAASVSERTVRRRLADPAFRAALQEARRELVTRALAVAAAGAVGASGVLLSLLKARSEFARLGAAKTVLQMALQGIELQALTERIEALEARLSDEGEASDARASY